jgi:hypothetical protein
LTSTTKAGSAAAPVEHTEHPPEAVRGAGRDRKPEAGGTGASRRLVEHVGQRRREIGVRMALEATPGSVARLIIWRGLTLTAVGLSLGGAIAWAGGRAMTSLLYGVTAIDPTTIAAVGALPGGVATLACSVPAVRAARVDPMAMRAPAVARLPPILFMN